MPIQLVVENLNASIDDKVVLHDLAVTAQAGHILALMGKGGCGKSTFLRVINRMAEEGGAVVSGHIMLDNSSIFMQDISLLRQKVGMVFTEPVLFAGNILGNITAGLRLQGIKKKQKLEECAEETLGYMGILEEFRDLLYTDASYLNRSQAQLVCIARALAVEPEVLLMDEPTSALDPISTSKIEELCMELKGKYTIVIVTHNMQQALRIADTTAFFLLGDMVEVGATDQLFSMPRDKRTEDYITGRFG